jgi:hypothetical protein
LEGTDSFLQILEHLLLGVSDEVILRLHVIVFLLRLYRHFELWVPLEVALRNAPLREQTKSPLHKLWMLIVFVCPDRRLLHQIHGLALGALDYLGVAEWRCRLLRGGAARGICLLLQHYCLSFLLAGLRRWQTRQHALST